MSNLASLRSEPAPRAIPGMRTKLLAGLLLLLVAIGVGRSFGHYLPALEAWIAGHGPLGWAAFIVLVVVGTSVFVPDSVFAVLAGVLFDVVGGTVLMSVAALLAAVVDFQLSRRLLHRTVRRWLDRNPRLNAVEGAVNREGLRFQFLLRLTPLSPVAVSYTLGVTRTRFPVFLAACLGIIPGLALEVYFGHLAKHVVRTAAAPGAQSHLQLMVSLAGLLACVGLMAYVTRLALRAVAAGETKDSAMI